MDLEQIILTLQHFFDNHKEVSFGHLFGSFARNRTRPQSDLDIAIYLSNYPKESAHEYKFSTMIELQDIFNRPVDLILLNEAPPLLKHEIFKTGILFIERDHATLVDYKVQNYHQYQNQLYLLNHFFDQMKAKIQGEFNDQLCPVRDPINQVINVLWTSFPK